MPIILLLLLSFTFSIGAFEHTVDYGTEKDTYNYQWQDHTQTEHQISFSLSSQLINNHFRRFKRYNSEEAINYIHREVLREASKFNPRELRLEFTKHFNYIDYQLTSSDKDKLMTAQQSIEKIKLSAHQDYLEKNYYIKFSAPWHKQAIKPDHLRFVKESFPDIKPIAHAIQSKYPNARPQALINFVLSWIQSIPYADLEDRSTSSGVGFNPPLRLLSHNQGDCDSKTVLAASIIKTIYPRLNIALIYLPEHALIGFHLPIRKGEKYIDIEGLKYLLAEPVGPAKLPIAQVDDKSWQLITSGQYYYEVL